MTSRRRDSGQILIAAALLIPVLLGMAALAVDLGSYTGGYDPNSLTHFVKLIQ